jgi:hypothetical protein
MADPIYVITYVKGKKKIVVMPPATVSDTVISGAVQTYLTANPPASYTHPSTHPATMITDDTSHRFVSDTEKGTWNSKQTALGFTPCANDDARLTNDRNPTTHGHIPSDIQGTAIVEGDARLGDNRAPLTHTHAQGDITNLATTLSGKETANSNIQTHVSSAHAPSNAQKNSDITAAEIEAKLTGAITTHSHATPTWKGGITTRDITTASGTQTIAHGLGRVPKFVRIDGAVIISAAITQNCVGIFDGTNNSGLCIAIGEGTSTAATDAVYSSATIALGFSPLVATNVFTGANRQTGVITVDATNIIITWTKTGTVASAVASLIWQCT